MAIIRDRRKPRESIRDLNPFPITVPVDRVLDFPDPDTRSGTPGDFSVLPGYGPPTLIIENRSDQYRITERDITDSDSREYHLDLLYEQERSNIAEAKAKADASICPC